ncbi:MAG: MATE family efflux transporter [Saccharofermentans sp.]|nr:MATE family efflux transporter [Saccharofermentans sp.]
MSIKRGKSVDFGQGSVTGHVLRQAFPLLLSQLVQLLYNIVDRMYIGHIPDEGTDALTGLGLTFPVVSVILAFTMLFGQGGAPVFAIAMGSRNEQKASKVLGNSFSLMLISSVCIAAALYIGMKPVLYALGASDVTYPYACAYLRIYLLGTTATMLANGLNFYISNQGFPVTAMITTLTGALLNIILDPVFIFALHMNIRGAALATVISQTASMIWVLVFLTGEKPKYKIRKESMKLVPEICREICLVGITGFIMQFTNSATQTVCNRTLLHYGGDLYVGIMTVVGSVRDIMTVAVNAFASGAQPVISFNFGAHKFDRVRSGIKVSFLLAFVYTGIAWLLIFLFPGFFISLFTKDTDLINASIPALHIFFLAYIFMAFQFSGQSTFMSLEKNGRAICFSLFRKVVLVIPLTILLPKLVTPSVNGVFMAEPVSNVVGGLASFITMYFTVYRRLSKSSDGYDGTHRP